MHHHAGSPHQAPARPFLTDTDAIPRHAEPWLQGGDYSVDRQCADASGMASVLRRATRLRAWRWPGRKIFFITDAHADADAFIASLVASGGIRRTGSGESDFDLTPAGRKAVFVIGGDCLDKGPSNLRLLRAVRHLMTVSKRVKLLAGNHDKRLLLGLRGIESQGDVLTEHLFVRMGAKSIPLLEEVYHAYPERVATLLAALPGHDECRRRLFPRAEWYDLFPARAASTMPPAALKKEVRRIRDKSARFEALCTDAGLGLREVYATALLCRELFLQPDGEFAWFFERMQLVHRAGSFLFVHAGIDDKLARQLARHSAGKINRKYRRAVQEDPFGFYFGHRANAMRTKYRDTNFPLTAAGIEHFHRAGLHAVVHGHRSSHTGQRLMLRHGVLHIECDTTMDANSRRREGLPGPGVGVTIIDPAGAVIGLSSDYARAKVFSPGEFLYHAETRRYEKQQTVSPRIPRGL